MDNTTRYAIEKTLELHMAVVDGEFIDYTEARNVLNDGECPLCEAFLRSCEKCPWLTIQGVSNDIQCAPCYRKERYLNYNNSYMSVKRLKCWLEGGVFHG